MFDLLLKKKFNWTISPDQFKIGLSYFVDPYNKTFHLFPPGGPVSTVHDLDIYEC